MKQILDLLFLYFNLFPYCAFLILMFLFPSLDIYFRIFVLSSTPWPSLVGALIVSGIKECEQEVQIFFYGNLLKECFT